METFFAEHHGWYIIVSLFLHNTGVLVGSIIAYQVNYSAFSPSATLSFIGLPTLSLSFFMALYFFIERKIETPARYLEQKQLNKVSILIELGIIAP